MTHADKIDYFIDQTNKRLEDIEEKLDVLISFRIMLIGASVTASTLVTFGLNFLFSIYKH